MSEWDNIKLTGKYANVAAKAVDVANQLEAQGIDPIKALEALPGFVGELRRVRSIDDQEKRIASRDIAVLDFMRAIRKEE